MYVKSATDARKSWSETCDDAVRTRPGFIKRTRDLMVLASAKDLLDLLQGYRLTVVCEKESDGSYTAYPKEIDIIENAPSRREALLSLGKSMLEYAEEYYSEYDLYSRAPNRRGHAPYVFKALLLGDSKKIADDFKCRTGKN